MVANSETCVQVSEPVCAEKPIESEAQQQDAAAVTEEDFEKAQKLFQQGKKNLILSKFDEAANNIADACKTYSMKYGELNYQCADVYFYYGKALLELARVENTVLGNALNGVLEENEPINDSRYGNPDTVPEEERNEIFDKVIDAMCEDDRAKEECKDKEEKKDEAEPMSTEVKPETETKEEAKEEVKEETKTEEAVAKEVPEKEAVEEKKEEEENAEMDVVEKKEENEEENGADENDEENEEGEDVEECEKTNKEDEDDVTNLQQSWEMFELAKVIYLKQKDLISEDEEKLKARMRISECLLKLGEIGIEQELFEQAVNDIKESIRIQEDEVKVNERDERLLAESYYQLTLAYQFNNQYELAKESHNKATNILYLRIDKLKARLTEENLEECIKNQINDEIAEIEQLLPEMCAKLEEISEQGQQSLNLIKEAKECIASGYAASKPGFDATASNGTNGVSTNVEVKDITGLVKSKRKLSTDKLEDQPKTEEATTETKVEEPTPTPTPITETTNGHVEMEDASGSTKRRLSTDEVDNSSKKTKVEEPEVIPEAKPTETPIEPEPIVADQ